MKVKLSFREFLETKEMPKGFLPQTSDELGMEPEDFEKMVFTASFPQDDKNLMNLGAYKVKKVSLDKDGNVKVVRTKFIGKQADKNYKKMGKDWVRIKKAVMNGDMTLDGDSANSLLPQGLDSQASMGMGMGGV